MRHPDGSREIIGATIGRIGPVRNVIHIGLAQGVTALYGINGVGKTRVLSLLRHALSGTSPEPERPGLPAKAILDIHVRAEGREEELLAALDAWDGNGGDPSPWRDALEEAAAAGVTTLRAVGDSFEPRWQEFLSVSPTLPHGAEALRKADAFWTDRRINEVPWAAAMSSMPPFSIPYWGMDAFPLWARDLPAQTHVPTISLGVVDGERFFEEVRQMHGTTSRVRDFHSGFRLATTVTNFEAPLDPDASTLERLLQVTDGVSFGFFDGVPGSIELDDDVAEFLDEIQARANELIRHVLIDPPHLTFDLLQPEDWIRGSRPRWRADGLDFDHLSRSQQHWVAMSVELAQAPRPVVFICDEPETGLHKAAEQRLATGLSAMAQFTDAPTVLATHSPKLLASPLIAPVLVTNDAESGTDLRHLDLSVADGASMRDTAGRLGLTVGDLMSLMKLTIVVEGIHDEWVFGGLLRDSIDAAPAGILPMHGGTRLRSLADARLVIDGTDSTVLVVLDDLAAQEASALFEKVKAAHRDGDVEARATALEELRQRGRTNDSYLFVHQFALRAVEVDSLERVHLHGLSLPDVICYLDPDTVLLQDRPWNELIAEWTAEAAPHPPKNIKGWLRRKKLLPDSPSLVDEAIERAVLSMLHDQRPLHPDLVELAMRIGSLAN